MNRGLAALGALVAAVGLAAAVEPRLVAGLSTPFLIVVLLGALALFQAVRVGWSRYRGDEEVSLPALPDVERRELSSVPGDTIDGAIRTAVTGHYGGPSRKRAVREELEETAVAVLERYDGLSPEQARDQLGRGVWTDDRYAAAFFSPGMSADLSFRDRLRVRASGETMFERQTRAVTTALLERVEAGRQAGPAPRARSREDPAADDAEEPADTRTRPDYAEMSLEELFDPAGEPEGER